MFDIGANRGDAVFVGLQKGFDKIIAVEAGPKVFKELVKNFIYEKKVIPINFAVSDMDNDQIEFYECIEDGLSTIEKSWLTDPSMPYYGKQFRTIGVNTITIDRLSKLYGPPNLIKIDVEGAEWKVFKGMTRRHGPLCFEWTIQTIDQHVKQLEYLASIGYTSFAPQFIVPHLKQPESWIDIEYLYRLNDWINKNSKKWEDGEWKEYGLRPTADVGMIWVH